MSTDCADQLGVQTSQHYQLEVTLKFTIDPDESLSHLDASEVAAQRREEFLGNGDIVAALDEAVTNDDYQLKVQPVFYD